MRALLSGQLARKLDFLDYLAQKKWVKLEDASHMLQFSESTLINDIKELNDMLAPIHIKTSTKQGIKLVVPTNYTFQSIYAILLSQSIEYNIIETVFLTNLYSVKELATVLYCSVSQIRFKMKRINSVLKQHDIELLSKPLHFEGDEKNISYLLFFLFAEKYNHQALPFPNSNQKKVELYIKTIKNYSQIDDRVDLQKMKLWLLIRQQRIKKGYLIEPVSENTVQIPDTLLNEAFWDFLDLPRANQLSQDIFVETYQGHFFWTMDTFEEVYTNSSIVYQRKQIILTLLESIEKRFGIAWMEKERLILTIYNRLSISYHDILSLSSLSESTEPFHHQLLETFSKEFQTELHAFVVFPWPPHNNKCPKIILEQLIDENPELVFLLSNLQPSIKVLYLTNSEQIRGSQHFLGYLKKFLTLTHITSKEEQLGHYLNDTSYHLLLTDIEGLELPHGETYCLPLFPTFYDYIALLTLCRNIALTLNEKEMNK